MPRLSISYAVRRPLLSFRFNDRSDRLVWTVSVDLSRSDYLGQVVWRTEHTQSMSFCTRSAPTTSIVADLARHPLLSRVVSHHYDTSRPYLETTL